MEKNIVIVKIVRQLEICLLKKHLEIKIQMLFIIQKIHIQGGSV